MIFVDTNYFLRFLLKDVPHQHQKALQLFKDGAAGKIKLISSTIVIFKILWVLTSYYKKDKQEAVNILEQVLQMRFIQFEKKRLIVKGRKVKILPGNSWLDKYQYPDVFYSYGY